jgi:hypothetical protein
MGDSLDCFSLCFCCFCFSICGQSETSSCPWLCGCCRSHRDFEDEPALKDPELDAIVERQLYEQRAAWAAANPGSNEMQHPYAAQIPSPAKAMTASEKAIGHRSQPSSASQTMLTPSSMNTQPGNVPAMSELPRSSGGPDGEKGMRQ